jgi:hypothetical protein
VVRIVGKDGDGNDEEPSASVDELSDGVFGNSFYLKSQKLNSIPTDHTKAIKGVYEVEIQMAVDGEKTSLIQSSRQSL